MNISAYRFFFSKGYFFRKRYRNRIMGPEYVLVLHVYCQLLSKSWSVVSDSLRPHGLYSPQNSPAHCSGQPLPFSGDLPNPGIKSSSCALQADSLPAEPQGKLPKGLCQFLLSSEVQESASYGGLWAGKEDHAVDDFYIHERFHHPLRVGGNHCRLLDRRSSCDKLYQIHLRLALVLLKEYTGWVVGGRVLVFALLKPAMAS